MRVIDLKIFMNIEEELKSFKARIDPKIEAYFQGKIEEAYKEDPLVGEALEYVKTIIMAGGKRLRAALLYYGYLGAGGTEEEKILDTAVSVELIHSYLLIHDDIMDRDALRHGVATLHEYYAKKAKSLFPDEDAKHFGMSLALIMGDVVSAFGNDIIFNSGFPKERVFAALSRLQHIVTHTVFGQAKDLYMEYQHEASEEEILAMYTNKTAKYTIEGPLHLGILLAGGNEALAKGLSAYALPLGIAFQIQDDILGIFGSEKRIGKPLGSDIKEGKITLLVSRARALGNETEKKRIQEILGLGEALKPEEITEFRELMEKTGALAQVQEKAQAYIRESKEALEKLRGALDPRTYDFLFSVAEYMMKRER